MSKIVLALVDRLASHYLRLYQYELVGRPIHIPRPAGINADIV